MKLTEEQEIEIKGFMYRRLRTMLFSTLGSADITAEPYAEQKLKGCVEDMYEKFIRVTAKNKEDEFEEDEEIY